jgi:uncharacterized protein
MSETLPCPICRKPVQESTRNQPGSAYPFCSDRCRLIDLGRWLSGEYQIPVREDDQQDAAEPPDRRQ